MIELKLGRVYVCTFECSRSQDYCFVIKMAAEALGFETSFYHMNEQDALNQLVKDYRNNDIYIPKIIFFLLEKYTVSNVNEKEISQSICAQLHPQFFMFTKSTSQAINNLFYDIESDSLSSELFVFKNLEDLHQKAYSGLIAFNNSRRSSIATVNGSDANIYIPSCKLIKDAKHHIILCQNTSSLLLGPRVNTNTHSQERDFNTALQNLPLRRNLDKNFTFTHIFSKSKTIPLIESGSQEYNIVEARNELISFINNAENFFTCNFIYIEEEKDFPPFVIADFNLLFRLQLGNQKFNIELPHSISDLCQFKEQLQDPNSYYTKAKKACFNRTMSKESKEKTIQNFLNTFYK